MESQTVYTATYPDGTHLHWTHVKAKKDRSFLVPILARGDGWFVHVNSLMEQREFLALLVHIMSMDITDREARTSSTQFARVIGFRCRFPAVDWMAVLGTDFDQEYVLTQFREALLMVRKKIMERVEHCSDGFEVTVDDDEWHLNVPL